MYSHHKNKSLTELIASKSENQEIKNAVKSGKLHILCDPIQKKFWFACCPDNLWDTVIAEIKHLTEFVPLIDDSSDDIFEENEFDEFAL